MSDILRLTIRTRLLGLAATLLLIALALAPDGVRADSVCGGVGTTTYYSDAYFSTVVGQFGQGCCSSCPGSPNPCPAPCSGWGYTTSFSTFQSARCPQVFCRSPQ